MELRRAVAMRYETSHCGEHCGNASCASLKPCLEAEFIDNLQTGVTDNSLFFGAGYTHRNIFHTYKSCGRCSFFIIVTRFFLCGNKGHDSTGKKKSNVH